MRLSNVRVEQITKDSTIVDDFGEILTFAELKKIIQKTFPNVYFDGGFIYGSYVGKKFCIFCKNISYLGNPHPHFKKRIQIPNSFLNLYKDNKRKGIETILLGLYKYKDTLLFCDFDVTRYVNQKAHNSSAHVNSIDLLNANRFGFFPKRDFNGNLITTFNVDNIEKYLKNKLSNSHNTSITVFDTLDDFFANMTKEWFGLDAYYEMIENDYKNKFQPEWPGFYLEYLLSNYIKKNNAENVIKFYQDRKKGHIDLDLVFPELGIFGDLKAHSINSGAIQGNDFDTIMDLLEKQSIYYIVVNHETEKDKNHGGVVTDFWNKIQKKDDLTSYSDKMKYSVKLKSYYVLELNKYNKKYLGIYHQGVNSDGKPREPKVMISNKNINNFIVHSVEFE